MAKTAKENKILKSGLKTLLHAFCACLFLIVVWIVAQEMIGNPLLLPDLFDCVKETGDILALGGFWKGFFSTLARVFSAFGISFVFALFFAFIAYLLPSFGAFFAPLISFLRALPTLAVLLVLLIWSGAAKAPVIVAFLSLFPLLYTAILSALQQTDEELIQMSKVYQVPLRRQILQLYLPSSAPYVCRESGAALGFSVKLVVSAEVLASTYQSLGGMMQEAKLYAEMPRLFALIGISFVTGMLLELFGVALSALLQRRRK